MLGQSLTHEERAIIEEKVKNLKVDLEKVADDREPRVKTHK